MDLRSTPRGLLEREARRRRIILSQSQKDTLCAWFEKNPYPDIATRGQLAKEIGISESQILTWFQKHRKNQKRLEWEGSLEECQSQGQEKPHFKAKAKELGRPRTHFTKFQTDILVEAFEKNRFPGIATREELAKRTGLPESRIHIWFQNRRSRHPGKNKDRPVNSLAEGPHSAAQQLPQSSQCPASTSSALPSPCEAVTSNSVSARALSPPNTSPGPLDLSRGCERQQPKVTMTESSQAVQRTDNPTLAGHLPTGVTPGEVGFHKQAPCLLLPPGDPSENTSSLPLLPFKDSPRALPPSEQFQVQDHRDMPLFLKCWDEWFQSMLAEWVPDRGYWSPEQTEITLRKQQLPPPAHLSPRPDGTQ
uniref:double homeobox protein B-like n=1 Tax=Jaculus jaculus TaxID=51337 RepID=UPI001E1B0B57|nr:double homeobox protein B-like [Jaculus jaculus]